MKLQSILEAINYASDNPEANPEIVRKFADVDAKHRSYYIMKWAEKKGIDSDDAMFMAGYVQDGYIGAGAWNWRYVGMDESVQEVADNEVDGAPDYNPARGGYTNNMIGEPDDYYDAEQRQEAYDDLQTALDGVRNDWEKQSVIDGVCPECSGTSYMDGDYDNDEDSCYGWGNYGCDRGEMENATWVEIIKFDQQNVDRQQAKANYPGDEAVIDFAASTAKQLKSSGQDPRDTLEYVKKEYPGMGRAQRASLVAKGMKKAGLTSEGKSPHKKGSAKYKNHMAAKHASMGENINENKWKEIETNSDYMLPVTMDNRPLDWPTYWEWEQSHGETNKNRASLRYGNYVADAKQELSMAEGEQHGNSKIYKKCWTGYSKVPGKKAGEKGSCKKNEGRIEDTFGTDTVDKHDKPKKKKTEERIQAGDELMIETADGEGITVPVLHVVNENILIGWDELAEDIVVEGARQLAELKKLAGLDEGDIEMYAKPDQVKKTVQDIIKNGLRISKKFVNWCKDNNVIKNLDANAWASFVKDPKNLQKIAIAKLNFEKETGYGTDGEILTRKPPTQKELPFSPRNKPEQQEFDFDEDLDEAEYQGRKVKLGKPTRGDVKKFKVYVKDPKTGNVKKVNFGHGGTSAKKAGQKTMKIKKSNPARRKSFRARHNCDNPGPRTKARYWSCRAW